MTLEKDLGDGAGFVPFAGAHVDVTLTNSNGATHTAPTGTCTTAGPNTDAAGQCTITFTSPTPGKVTGNASWTGSLGTPTPFTVTTNGTGGSSGPAVKTFVDANIQITPQTAANPIGTDHTLTIHVNVNAGGGSFANAPAGTAVTASLTNAGGATAAFVGPNTCTTVGTTGSCTVVISSSTTGTTTIHATTTVIVGGVPLTRATGDAKLGDSADATKLWANDTIRTDVHDANHAVITKVEIGTVVHDKAFVTRTADTPAEVPNPTGTVTFHRYANIVLHRHAGQPDRVARRRRDRRIGRASRRPATCATPPPTRATATTRPRPAPSSRSASSIRRRRSPSSGHRSRPSTPATW